MLADARDFLIVVWIVSQGLGWVFPQSYGQFKVMEEVAYMETMEKLGVWDE